MHTQYNKYTYNNTRPTNNNYKPDNLKLATIDTKQIRIFTTYTKGKNPQAR